MGVFRKDRGSSEERYDGQHRFEHWYRDNTVYFITSSVRDHFPAFTSEQAKAVFWNRFDFYAKQYRFVPWITSLLDNHYHTIGYLRVGEHLGQMMRRIHGSVAKLSNDLLPFPHRPFWRESGGRDYFDGCLRDEKQCRLAYRYTLLQCKRHGICNDPKDYPHTRVNIDLERGLNRALALKSFLSEVPYARYDRSREKPS